MNKEKRGRKERESRAGGEKGEEPTLMGKGGRTVRTGAKVERRGIRRKRTAGGGGRRRRKSGGTRSSTP